MRAFAHGGEDAEAIGIGEGFGGVGGFGQRSPVSKQVLAMGLQRVGVAFMEVDAGELTAAQEGEGGVAVTFAHCGGEGGEIQFCALAPAAGQVDVAGGEDGRGGGWVGGFTRMARSFKGRVGGGEDAGEHVASFHRGQLVGVAEEDEACAVGHGFDQLGHQRQVDHGGFVHHHHVERQRVVGVVAEAGAVGEGAEQAVQGGAGGGQVGAQGGVDAGFGQRAYGVAHAFGHALGGAAGGGGQGDARGGGGGLQRLGDQQHQHAGDGGGLAGAGAAGDQQQVVVQRRGGGLGLQVFATGVFGEEPEEELREVRGHLGALPFGVFNSICGIRRDAADAAQAFGQAALVLAVAAQVDQAVLEHERGVGGGFGVAGVRTGNPAGRRQRLPPALRRGPVDGLLHQPLGFGGVEAGVAGGDRQRGQGSGGEHGVGGVGIQPAQAVRQRLVQRAQGAGFHQCVEQAHATAPLVSPANRASSACTSSGSKRQA